MNGQIINLALSSFLLAYLLFYREIFTPDFFHYISILNEDMAHMVWTFIMFSIYKCFFCIDSNSNLKVKAQLIIFYVQVLFGLLLSDNLSTQNILLYLFGTTLLFLRSYYFSRTFTFFLFSFILLYFT